MQTETKTGRVEHTPGPWHCEHYSQYHRVAVSPPRGYCQIAQLRAGFDDEMDAIVQANARLMAAAPDLLKACKRARIALTFYREDMARNAAPNMRDYPFGIDVETELESLIAKAEGKTA